MEIRKHFIKFDQAAAAYVRRKFSITRMVLFSNLPTEVLSLLGFASCAQEQVRI